MIQLKKTIRKSLIIQERRYSAYSSHRSRVVQIFLTVLWVSQENLFYKWDSKFSINYLSKFQLPQRINSHDAMFILIGAHNTLLINIKCWKQYSRDCFIPFTIASRPWTFISISNKIQYLTASTKAFCMQITPDFSSYSN